MKYAFMSFSCPELGLEQLLQVAKAYGYQGVEPRAGAGHKHGIELTGDEETLSAAREMAAQSGIALCCIATSCAFSDPRTADENVEVAKQYCDLAQKVGAPVIRVFGGMIPGDIKKENAFDSIVSSLKKLCDHAARTGVKVCLETHDSWRDPYDVARMMQAVNHEAIRVNWDVMHTNFVGYTAAESFAALAPWIAHVHVHDGCQKDNGIAFAPMGSGEVDVAAAIGILRAAGYEGFISGEWIGWEAYDIHLPREIKQMLRYEADEAQ